MANQSKLTLDDNLWPSLPKNFFKDVSDFESILLFFAVYVQNLQCLLSASPQDAIKWLPVSNEIKAFMEANRDKMRRFRNCNFFIAVKNQQDVSFDDFSANNTFNEDRFAIRLCPTSQEEGFCGTQRATSRSGCTTS